MRFLEQGKEYVISLYRIVIGLLFVCHGASSLFGMFGAKKAVAFGVWPSWWAAAIQLVAGGLVLVGLFTRVAALLCSGSMAYAYFTVHLPKSFFPMVNGGEASVQFLLGLPAGGLPRPRCVVDRPAAPPHRRDPGQRRSATGGPVIR